MIETSRLAFEPEVSTRNDADWQRDHRRYYEIAGISIQVESDLPFLESTFAPKFKQFEITNPGLNCISIRHHFGIPKLAGYNLGNEIYHNPPWAVYRRIDSWIYCGILPEQSQAEPYQLAIFSNDHTSARIYNGTAYEQLFRKGNLTSLTMFPTDQILLGRVLADHNGCYLHSTGLVLNGKGLIFLGHSEAGKSTITKMLQSQAQILCDDRNIVRCWSEGLRIHGTWSHGDVPVVSNAAAPLEGIFFLHKSSENRVIPIKDQMIIVRDLLACLVKPLVTGDWWNKELGLVDQMARQVPCYNVEFDTSGKIVDEIVKLTA